MPAYHREIEDDIIFQRLGENIERCVHYSGQVVVFRPPTPPWPPRPTSFVRSHKVARTGPANDIFALPLATIVCLIGLLRMATADETPVLCHKIKNDKSILALVISSSRIYAGTQDGEIFLWSLGTYELLSTIVAHRRSILSLHLSQDEKLLFSSAGDAIVNVWCTGTLQRLYSIYSTYDVGDVFCVAYSSKLKTLYLGAQNTTIQWYDLSKKDSRPPPHTAAHPSQRLHRFFDSKGPGGLCTPRPVSPGDSQAHGGQELDIDKEHVRQYAHYGYVYCMLLTRGLPGIDKETLISGGGDGTIKLWDLNNPEGIRELACLKNGDESILAIAIDGILLYSGRLEGAIDVWDIDTRQLVRTVQAHTTDVLTLAVGYGLIFSGGANGYAKVFNKRYICVKKWNAHSQLILASGVASYNGQVVYVTGGNDNSVAIWNIGDCIERPSSLPIRTDEQLLDALTRLVSFRTVSSDPQYAEDCRRGASWLRGLFKSSGASTEMLAANNDANPIVFAHFKGKGSSSNRKKVLFYGHYDVIAAENEQGKWDSDPFSLQGVNGYLYGRGVSDNKGPVLAALYGAADLLAARELVSDIVFIIEGEEECGSRGFQEAIRKNKHLIGEIDWILSANSYWLDDDTPCLTYGLRGVVQATVQIENDHPDLHSGVDGTHLMHEPLKDLVMLLSALNGPNGEVKIPGFYAPVLPVTEAENDRYDAISNTLLQRNPDLGTPETLTAELKARWREPSLTIHNFKTSGPTNPTIIPHSASVVLSFRLVPDQNTLHIQEGLKSFLGNQFQAMQTLNRLSIHIDHQAEPWLGDPNNQIFRTLEEAIIKAWGPTEQRRKGSVASSQRHLKKTSNGLGGPTAVPITSSTLANSGDLSLQTTADIDTAIDTTMAHSIQSSAPQKPLYIREGGSIPAIRFLEQEFNAPAAHLPCGQASDSAHLNNERLRLSNLYKAREIFRRVFKELPAR